MPSGWVRGYYRGGGPSGSQGGTGDGNVSDVPPQGGGAPAPAPTSMGGTLGSKWLGIPVWVWLGFFIVAVLIYMHYKSTQSSSSTSTSATGSTLTNQNTQGVDTSPLASNLVGVAQPQPSLAGSYQVQISPEQGSTPINNTSTNIQNPPSDYLTQYPAEAYNNNPSSVTASGIQQPQTQQQQASSSGG